MKWRKVKNRDVIDQRGGGGSGGGGGLGGLGGGFPGGAGKMSGGTLIIVIVGYILLQLLSNGSGGGSGGFNVPAFDPQAPQGKPVGIPASKDPQLELKQFSTYVFTDTQKFWDLTFGREGKPYEHAKLILYSGGVQTGCGSATSAVGPFYCPPDQSVYLDLSFYEDMRKQLGASGDFAWAYVIAHEMGHHVQNQLGTSDEVERASREDSGDANELSVRLELQADCYAGVWAKTVFAKGDLEEGDIEEAFNASEAVGDDRLQKKATGHIDPDSFTHGTSAQRREWFTTGYDSGDPAECDTFSPDEV